MSHRSPAGLPLHLCQVLEEETAKLWGVPSVAPSWQIAERDLDEIALLARLRDARDNRAQALLELLGEPVRSRLDEAHEPELVEQLVAGLNRLLDRTDLHRLPPFEGLGGEAEDLCEIAGAAAKQQRQAGDAPATEPQVRPVNRLLLEAAFPDEIRRYFDGRLKAAYERLRQVGPRSALCLSGGGVRSAVFSLGVVQALAGHGLLGKFDYLSTVSGGGYLGGLLSSWIHRHPRGVEGVAEELSGPLPAGPARQLSPESKPLVYLRSFCNYLNPRSGLFSADTWVLVAVFLRNLTFNWVVLLPLLASVLLIPWLYVVFLLWAPQWGQPDWLPGTLDSAHLALFLGGSLLMTGSIAYIGLNRPSGLQALRSPAGASPGSRAHRWRRRAIRGGQARFLVFCLLPLVVSAAALTVFWAWYRGRGGADPSWLWFAALTVLVNASGWGCHALNWFWFAGPAGGSAESLWSKLREIPAVVAAGLFGATLTWFFALHLFPQPVEQAPAYLTFAVPAVLGCFLAGETVFAGLVGRWTQEEDREWWARCGGWMLIAVAVWLAVSFLVVAGPPLLRELPGLLGPLGGLSGVLTAFLAHSAGTSMLQRTRNEKPSPIARAMDWALGLAAPLFVFVLLAAVALGIGGLVASVGGRVPHSSEISQLRWKPQPPPAALPGPPGAQPPAAASAGPGVRVVPVPVRLQAGSLRYLDQLFQARFLPTLLTLATTLALSFLTAWFLNVNRFSLHATYRNRLIRTFLGATRRRRRPNRFTGFDPADNFAMSRLVAPLFFHPGATGSPDSKRKAVGERLCRRLGAAAAGDSPDIVARLVVRRLSRELRQRLAQAAPDGTPSDFISTALPDHLNDLVRRPFEPELRDALESGSEERRELDRVDEEGIWRRRQALARAFASEIFDPPPRPFHLVNLALNLVQGENLAWQQRKAEAFSVSPLHCGNCRLGYRPSDRYAVGDRRGLTLGTAMAVSGAAASPNMGYHSSPAITFLMSFFNVRLGWWLGNPGLAGGRRGAYEKPSPSFSVGPLIMETLGLTNARRRFVYLSDGGHFENLGLYEMVLRRCPWIVVVDAGQDPDCRFEDLANAVRKVRVDLGVDIRFAPAPGRDGTQAEGMAGRYCALGTLRYPDGTQGRLLYFKPVVCGDEPRDVFHYHARNPQFPHESTGDQWFSESQFESYRRLGAHAVDTVVGALRRGEAPQGVGGLFACAEAYLEGGEAEPPAAPKPARGRARRAASSSA